MLRLFTQLIILKLLYALFSLLLTFRFLFFCTYALPWLFCSLLFSLDVFLIDIILIIKNDWIPANWCTVIMFQYTLPFLHGLWLNNAALSISNSHLYLAWSFFIWTNNFKLLFLFELLKESIFYFILDCVYGSKVQWAIIMVFLCIIVIFFRFFILILWRFNWLPRVCFALVIIVIYFSLVFCIVYILKGLLKFLLQVYKFLSFLELIFFCLLIFILELFIIIIFSIIFVEILCNWYLEDLFDVFFCFLNCGNLFIE